MFPVSLAASSSFPPLHLRSYRRCCSLYPSPPPLLQLHHRHRRSLKMLNWFQKSLSQRFNSGGIALFIDVVNNNPQLALPHATVPDARWLDWEQLRRLGFQGVVFDKDNTLTAPYSLSLWPKLEESLRKCLEQFPGRIAVFSNSAGLYQYDPDGLEARALEEALGGVHVIRHETKKPTGTAEDIENYFGCSASRLVFVGDRHFTDVVFGNRHGFLTVLTEPLSALGEPLIVRQVRKIEGYLVSRWYEKGLKPGKHKLVSDISRCIQAPPL